MKTLFGFSTVVAFALSAVACSNTYAEAPSTLEVTGRVDTQLRTLDNASAVAVGSDGRTYSSYIQTNGSFRLSLPVGNVYRILFANSTMAGELRTIGHLVNDTSSGKSDEIAVKEGGTLNIGVVRPAGTSASSAKPACECDSDLDPGADKGDTTKGETTKGDVDKGDVDKGDVDKGDYTKGDVDKGDYTKGDVDKGDVDKGDDDWKTKPKDGDKDRLCDDATDVELVAEKAPGDRCAKSGSDKSAPAITKKSCSTIDKGSVDKTGSVDKGGSADSCTCSQECGSGSSCAASKCTADTSSGKTATK